MYKLSDRKKAVLLATIREYIKEAKPVSSKKLAGICGLNLSTASLRNILASLEADGLLTHPHTSAGRTPTVSGYRYYVNTVSSHLSLGLEQRRFIIDFFSDKLQVDELLKQTSRIIAKITSYMGLVIRYSFKKLIIKHVDLVPLSNNQLLLVVIAKTGEVLKDKLTVSKYDFNVHKLEQLLNKEFTGANLAQIEKKCEHFEALGLFGNIFQEITQRLITLIRQQQSHLYYDGVSNLLNFPEFSQINIFSGILSVFESSNSTINRISANLSDSTHVAIGDELSNLLLDNASLVIAPYHQNEQLAGAVGLIGPMRMDYEKAIATTDCVAGSLSNALHKMA